MFKKTKLPESTLFESPSTMTKAETVNEISQQTGLEKRKVLVVVEAFMQTIKGSLINKENVYLRGFGTFLVKHRAEKTARNIGQDTSLTVPAHDIPAFKPAPAFANEMLEASE